MSDASSLTISGLESHPRIERLARILWRHLATRCPGLVPSAPRNGAEPSLRIGLDLEPSLGSESFRIVPSSDGVKISGGDELGLVHGIGKFLRTSRYFDGQFRPAGEEFRSGRVEPGIRGIYFATHFHNYYHDAPLEEVIRYVEDLTLWGMNTLQVWFDMHHYSGNHDPEARRMIERLRAILLAAKELGVKVCLGNLGNEAYAGSPEELRADFNTGRATYGVELCPHKPGAAELLLRWYDELLEEFAAVVPDYVNYGPYDQGGCACEMCKPWGANGYLRIVEAKAKRTRERFPGVKIILNTWLFDYEGNQGEWEGLAAAFDPKPEWCDYVQADSHTTYPDFPLQQGVPGKLPLLNFPEISMWMMHPWGGFGANPLPGRFADLFDRTKSHISGGFPYSEGIYEDLNKVLWLQWYGEPDRTVEDILKEYIAYEFSPDVVDDVIAALMDMEKNHNHLWVMDWHLGKQARYEMQFPADPQEVLAKMRQADDKLSDAAKNSWRWRILLLRARLDAGLEASQGFVGNEACERAFEELTTIYHAAEAEYKCAPPTRDSIARAKSSEYSVDH